MKILLKNKICRSRDILATVTVDPTVCKTQTYSNSVTFRPDGPGTT